MHVLKLTYPEKFWAAIQTKYPILQIKALSFLIQFPSTYGCEQ